MKYIYKALLLIACMILFFIIYQNYNQGDDFFEFRGKPCVDSQGQVSQGILKLLSLQNIEHDGSLVSIVELTQAHWLRKPGQERWDVAEGYTEDIGLYYHIFNALSLDSQVTPTSKKYDYALWMGSAYPSVQERLEYLITQWEQGVRFDRFVILSGARPLTDAERDALQQKYHLADEDIPVTECEAMNFVYKIVSMPDAMRTVDFVVVDVPMQNNQNGTARRPTTGDTIDAWMVLNPTPGSCLVASNQPYVVYQDSVVKTLLPGSFSVETIGAQSREVKVSIYLDTLARILYQEKKRLHL